MKLEQMQRAIERTRFFELPEEYSVQFSNSNPTTFTLALHAPNGEEIGLYSVGTREELRYWIERDAWRHLALRLSKSEDAS